jgi:ubiquinone/menaquinone biosynthesis C-methylase UbiE
VEVVPLPPCTSTEAESLTDYREIYDDVFQKNVGYRTAENSPGLATVSMYRDLILGAGDDHLDVGCGAGFVVSALSSPIYRKNSHGADVSSYALSLAKERVVENNLHLIQGSSLPFEGESYDIVTCFDVLEHLDEHDAELLIAELRRVVRRNGLLIFSISVKSSVSVDRNGDNLHRTVRNACWWDERIKFDSYTYHRLEQAICGYLKA